MPSFDTCIIKAESLTQLYFIGRQSEFADCAAASEEWRKVLAQDLGQKYFEALPAEPQLLSCQGRKAAVFADCASTFDSLGLLEEQYGFGAWDWLLACRQSQGRGQQGRQWHSVLGSLFVSQILPALPKRQGARQKEFAPRLVSLGLQQTLLPLLIGAALVRALQSLGFPVGLKWPNDIVKLQSDQRLAGKVAGLLLEQKKGSLILGWGLNFRPLPQAGLSGQELGAASLPALPADYLELSSILGKDFSLIQLWQHCGQELQTAWKRWQNMSTAECIAEIEAVLVLLNQEVEFYEYSAGREPWQKTYAYLRGIGSQGELLLERPDGLSVKWRGSLRPIH